MGHGISRGEPNPNPIELRIGLDDRRWVVSVRQHVGNLVHRDPRPLEHWRSAEHIGRARDDPARLRQLIEARTNGLGRRTGVHDDRVGVNDRLARTADQCRHHRAPALRRKHICRLVRQLEADESVAREQSRIASSLHRTLQQAGIDDPMYLPQWYAGD